MKLPITLLTYAMLVSLMGISATYAGEQQIKRMLAKEMPGSMVTSITETDITGLYEVIMPPKILYVSDDAKFIVSGDIIEVSNGDNITLPKRDGVRAQAIELQGEDSMIIYTPKKVKHTITVFTDVDCGYCRKLHSEMSDYLKLGIRIRYMSYPRAGIGSESYNKAVSVWCSKNRKAAMDVAKSGRPIPEKTCKNPVRDHYSLGEKIGIRGTPAIVLESGQVVPGYVPADRLFAGLEQQKNQRK